MNEIRYRHIDCFDEGVFLDQKELPHSLSPGPVPPPRKVCLKNPLLLVVVTHNDLCITLFPLVLDFGTNDVKYYLHLAS